MTARHARAKFICSSDLKYSTSVLPWRGWPRRQGFWRRIEGTVTAGIGLGHHPALYPLNTHQGAAPRVAPLSLTWLLPASKTKSGPRAERKDHPFKRLIPLKGSSSFKGNAPEEVFHLKGCHSFKRNESGESFLLKDNPNLKGNRNTAHKFGCRTWKSHSIPAPYSMIPLFQRCAQTMGGVLVAPLPRNTSACRGFRCC